MASYLILLVDDDDLSREIIGLTLMAEEHRVLPASSGAAALRLIDSLLSSPETGLASDGIPQVVLTDMQMPEMTGRELCRRIRERWKSLLSTAGESGYRQPLLIGMSATEMPEEQLQEFDAFVTKPLEAGALQTILAEKLERSQGRAGAAESSVDGPLDFAVIDKLRKLMPAAALDELFATYLSDTRNRLTQMEAFAAAGDQAEVRRCAHMMKGSAAMTGATGIRRVAALLETTTLATEEQRVLFAELRCTCDAIEGTLARDARNKEAHDHQTT